MLALRSELQPGDHFNPLLGLSGINVHNDTTVELLHTYVLGIDKYIWHATNSKWNVDTDSVYAARLRLTSIDEVSIPPICGDYLIQYKNNLIGKHFKTLQQVGVFHLYDGLCAPMIFDLWKDMGELGAMLWYHNINDMTQYLVSLRQNILHVPNPIKDTG